MSTTKTSVRPGAHETLAGAPESVPDVFNVPQSYQALVEGVSYGRAVFIA